MEQLVVENLQGRQFPAEGEVTRSRSVNGDRSINVSFLEEGPNERWLLDFEHHWKIIFKGQEYIAILPDLKPAGKKAMKSIDAIHRFFVDMKDDWVYEEISGSRTFNDRLQMVFNGSPYNYVIEGQFLATEIENFGDSSRGSLMNTAATRHGAEFELVEETTVRFKELIGRDTDFYYRTDFNLKDISVQVDASDFSTYGRGYGAYLNPPAEGEEPSGPRLEVEYTSPLAAIYGVKHHPPIRDERYSIRDNLYADVKKGVDESLQFSIEISIADLREQGFKGIPSEGDRLFVIAENLNIDLEARVIDLKETFDVNGNLIDLTLTLSNESIRNAYQSQLSNTVKQLRDLMEGRTQIPYQAQDILTRQATQALRRAQTELRFENGIIAIDRTDPNKMVLFNSAGIGVSKDGGLTFPEAITGLGINTSLLAAGAIQTNNIEIIGKSDYFFWDGNALTAINPDDIRKRVDLNSNGLDIKRGAVNIERVDGATAVLNGMIRASFDCLPSNPPYQSGFVTTEQRVAWFGTQYQEDTVPFDRYSVVHQARYLCVNIEQWNDGGGGCLFAIDEGGPDFSELERRGSNFSTNGNQIANNRRSTVIIDMGVPSYTQKVFYTQMRASGPSNNWAFCRISKMWQTDFL